MRLISNGLCRRRFKAQFRIKRWLRRMRDRRRAGLEPESKLDREPKNG